MAHCPISALLGPPCLPRASQPPQSLPGRALQTSPWIRWCAHHPHHHVQSTLTALGKWGSRPSP
eukprot:1676134-Amphidinium_carterae.1